MGYLYKKIMVAIDGSEYSERALDRAINLAKTFNSQIILLNVVKTEELEIVRQYSESSYELVKSYLEQTADKLLTEAEKKVRKKGIEDVVKKVAFGDPAEKIVDEADSEGVDLIAIGTRGLTGVKRVVLGSTTQKVMRWSNKDVLVVH
ncbi:MAG: universal stress protein [Candidatus Freyarchaeota archaeon]|nr:universal stress protein [Candidatus Jordarchaeia archaeon]